MLFLRQEQTTSAVSAVSGRASTLPDKVFAVGRRSSCLLLFPHPREITPKLMGRGLSTGRGSLGGGYREGEKDR